jgi:hypothetical protein
MTYLDRKLRSLDEIAAPDLWTRVGVPSGPRPTRSFPSPLRRAGIIAVALSLSVAAFAFAYFGLRTDRVDRPQPGDRMVSVAAPVRQGTLVCTVTAPGVVDPGRPLSIAFTVENISDQTREFSATGSTSYLVTNAEGVVYDTTNEIPIFGPMVPPIEIAPGETWGSGSDVRVVEWGGPLMITPACLGATLPGLTIDVAVPGPTPTVAEAIGRAEGTNGALMGECRPAIDESPTVGTIQTPTPADVPDMSASCSATVTLHDGFALVRMLIVTPPGEHELEGIDDPYFRFSIPDDGRPIEVVVWDVVVTQDGANVAGGWVEARTASGAGMAPNWSWNGTGWDGPGASKCGALTNASGPGYIEFINACPSVAAAPSN